MSDGAAAPPEDVLVLRGGLLVDGSGRPGVIGDAVVSRGRIVSLGGVWQQRVDREIDARGQVVAPGFIDLHTHSDLSLLDDPTCVSALEQGITTQQVGQCGFSAAPLGTGTIAPAGDDPISGFPDVTVAWRSLGEYRAAVATAVPGTNVATLIGHNTVRRAVMGMDDRAPSEAETVAMVREVERGLDEGARGFSTGLTYIPGAFAEASEIVALVRANARRGGLYHTHMRYNRHGTAGAVRASVVEAIDTARSASSAVNISHLYPHPGDADDEAPRILQTVDDARRDGIDVTFDVTVFARGGGAFAQQLPRWAKSGGGEAIARRLSDAATRARLFKEMTGPDIPPWKRDWSDRLIVKVSNPAVSQHVGKSLGEIAGQLDVHPLEVAFDLLRDDPQFWTAALSKRPADLVTMLAHPLGVPVTDGLAAHPVKHRAMGLMPKTFGTFPHYFGHYVRERGVSSLEEGVRRATAVPAARMGLRDRGQLALGVPADIVTFDPDLIANVAHDHEPWLRPAGIGHVFVNGVLAVTNGQVTGRRAGVVL